ncbi:MAG: isoprenyl transferase [Magnetococcales bacterium]|nr:isoprenyl transferase [Magnetococcales bacterium]MBF0172441.1 isoprenyl transferase [Magnetococcales bacterium]MBF0347724.1 isoprenyl transferase [Magnetococcales bacterium]MBF0631383.1 isoprenyl transferase [Magnetococcales bacterium]
MPLSTTDKVPRHIAIVMDGNRRWAKSRFLPRLEGHRQGVKAVRRTVEACLEFGIPILTLYTFSAENWNRPQDEVSALMNLLAIHLRKEMDELILEGVRFQALGRISMLPRNIQELVGELQDRTRDNTRLLFNIALNYGGRQELVDAAVRISREVMDGQLRVEEIDEQVVSQRLTTAGMADPDLLIRTGGEQRISNFLLWQLAYSEMVFLPVFWPEFDANHLRMAIEEFGRRERRFGASA